MSICKEASKQRERARVYARSVDLILLVSGVFVYREFGPGRTFPAEEGYGGLRTRSDDWQRDVPGCLSGRLVNTRRSQFKAEFSQCRDQGGLGHWFIEDGREECTFLRHYIGLLVARSGNNYIVSGMASQDIYGVRDLLGVF